jgi:glucose-6-phosphate isomerase
MPKKGFLKAMQNLNTRDYIMDTLSPAKAFTSNFAELKASKRLSELAQAPFDLSKEGNLSAERIGNYVAEGCGFKLMYATERVDDATISTLTDLATETNAVAKMQLMQAGEIANCLDGHPSEMRAALHTAARDFFEAPTASDKAQSATKLAFAEVEKLRLFMEEIDSHNRYTDMVVIGIGGSELGPKAIYESLLPHKIPGRAAHFLGNIDPDAAAVVLQALDLSRTLVVVISKTGTTLETLTNEEIFRRHFAAIGLDSNKQFISVTSASSPMDDSERYLQVFHMWDWVGGRYSSTAMPGGVLLAFTYGFESFVKFLQGANAMDKNALKSSPKENLPLMAALLGIWNRNFLAYPALAIIPYAQALARFPAHIQQLDMESNGKQIDRMSQPVTYDTGPIIFGEPGTNAQHSFFQLIHQGTTVFPTEFIGFKSPQIKEEYPIKGTTSQQKLLANMFAQALALARGEKNANPNKNFPGNRPSSILIGSELTPYMVGALLSLYEHKVAFQGFIWGINSFDQMGVELGKKLANRIIDIFKDPTQGKSFPAEEALLKQLETL